jgi:SAM-dependent methyltransferase
MNFINVYEDAQRAEAYAKLEFPGTYYLAYRDLPEIIFTYVKGRKAIDFGCGTGRSTRFLKRIGFEAIGVDISEDMLEQARARDPEGDYRLIEDSGIHQLQAHVYDLVLSVFTFDNIPTMGKKVTLFGGLGRLLKKERGSELERAELQELRRLWSMDDSAYEYSFSVFVPQDFPIVPTRLVIAQWKQYCPVDRCTPDNPILAIRYQAGELFIAKQASAEKEVLYRTRDDIRNRWLDFKFQIRFSRSQSGRIRAWLGDTMVIDDKGVNAYPEAGG